MTNGVCCTASGSMETRGGVMVMASHVPVFFVSRPDSRLKIMLEEAVPELIHE